ncbi:MAG: hypothetical protein JJ934_13035 [Pseudomonadales bacterium]|nr:hypothetical protein [Pseudomonadales bacterium]
MTMKSTWISDAASIDVEELDEVLYETKAIRQFIQDPTMMYVAANKGMGKTLVLKAKRHHMETTNPAIRLIPSDTPYLDLMGGRRELNDQQKALFDSLNTSEKMWSFSLKTSILLHFRQNDIAKEICLWLFPDDHIERLKRPPTPTECFRALFNKKSVSEVHSFLDNYENTLDGQIESLHTPIAIFIDKVDQGVHGLTAKQWTNVQAGLIEVSFALSETNNHIKSYCSIRQEAFTEYTGHHKFNLIGQTLQISYDKQELHDLVENLIAVYERKKDLREFVGFSELDKNGNGIPEFIFDYIYRHTLGRPRDFVTTCGSLSAETRMDVGAFRRVVNTANSQIAPLVIAESKPFLSVLYDDELFIEFCSMLPVNVLSQTRIDQIRKDLAAIMPYGADPFGDLYTCGLLGALEENAEGAVQRFKQPASFQLKQAMPPSDYYLIHPSLQNRIVANTSNRYRTIPRLVVGEGYPWFEYYYPLLAIYQKLWGYDKETNSELYQQVERIIEDKQNLVVSGEDNRVNSFELETWQPLKESLELLGDDGLHQALEALLSSKSVFRKVD